MNSLPIIESGMTFGPYHHEHFLYIEKSKLYKNIQADVRMAEFLILRLKAGRPPSIWIVEAKSSTPRPETTPDFNGFIEEIKLKFNNALSLSLAALLQRHKLASDELSVPFRALDLSAVVFRFVLVINGHQDSWLPPLQEALTKALTPTIKTWALSLPAVTVINEVMASEYGLITLSR